jgi:hypothetical protein
MCGNVRKLVAATPHASNMTAVSHHHERQWRRVCQSRSMTVATPCPTPMHIVASA